MNLIKSYTTKNPCYKNAQKITVKGLVIHSVGCPQPNASVFIKQFDSASVSKAVHAFIDANGNVYNTLPWDYKAWHVGGSANSTHIGVEMTEPATIKYTGGATWTDLNPTATKKHVLATYKTAVELFADLCKLHNLDPLKDGVILSHNECHKRGIGSGHADVEHIWNKFGLTTAQFRKDIKAAMGGTVVTPTVTETAKPAATTTTTTTATSTSYTVKVLTTLRIRSTPEIKSNNIVGSVKEGTTYTIVAEQNGFGKLKSGAGWISIDPMYVKRLTATVIQKVPVANTQTTTTTTTEFKPYIITVLADVLNIRSTPEIRKDNVVGSIKQGGRYTIIKEQNGFGKLKSGAGWISISPTYVKK